VDERRYLPALLIAFGLANLSAYGRDATIAAVFGANARTDAYFIGAFLPTLLTTILVLESTVPALLPTFSRLAADSAATRKLLRTVLAIGVAVLACAFAAIWMATDSVVRLLAHGWQTGQVHTAASLLRITSASLVPLGAGAVIAAVLNVRHRYLTPPLGMILMNGTVIAATLVLGGRLGIYAPAWGILAGSCVYLALQIWAVGQLGLERGHAHVDVPLGTVGRAMLPTLIFSFVVQNVTIVERWLASTLPAGRISYLTYAGKLMMSPLLVVTAAGGLVAFVAMSHAAAAGDEEAFWASLVRSARALTILLAAATVMLIVLRLPIVQLTLQHGHFTAGDASVTSDLLGIYALGLVPNGLAWLMYRSLQSRGRYWESLGVAAAVACLYVACAVALFRVWGLQGIATAFPISQVAACGLLYARQWPGMGRAGSETVRAGSEAGGPGFETGWPESETRPSGPRWAGWPVANGLRFAASMSLVCGGIAGLLVALWIGVADMPIGAMEGAALTLLGAAVIVPVGLLVGMRLLGVAEGMLVWEWLLERGRD
jgi:putative peptidoglycan lipid II flippase